MVAVYRFINYCFRWITRRVRLPLLIKLIDSSPFLDQLCWSRSFGMDQDKRIPYVFNRYTHLVCNDLGYVYECCIGNVRGARRGIQRVPWEWCFF